MVSWEQLLLEKNAVFYCKGETMTEMLMVPGEDFGREEREQWKAVLLHTQERGWGHTRCWWVLGSGRKLTPGTQPRGWFASAADRGLLRARCRVCPWAVLPPVLAGGTCQAAEGWAPTLERCDVFHPQGKLPPGSCLLLIRYGIS